ncbi:hypothetical protein CLV51_102805 [Chitinophaga niastensis]|uniref:Uncharacterized protein n=1 Tax=Chitinophaga niastensis TaxID=536980 RepID=A0A2P8HP16_CHINA|nr:hypothetical protein [Chitinophaga niastensis]PSL47945.1 hypothetical protein CLV51_102805 [Chitinophaga niastensis]
MSPSNRKVNRKKSVHIQLILITAVLASCHRPTPDHQRKVYMRGDSTAGYNRTHYGGGLGAVMWYYAFRPYGSYYGGNYYRAGYYSGGISEHANMGSNPVKGAVSRGGFGGNGFSVSS